MNIKITDLQEPERKEYEKHYTFSDLKCELGEYLCKNQNGLGRRSEMLFLAEKIVELQNRIIELENK